MAELMANEGEITACDISPGRLRRLEGNLHRLGVQNARVVQHDWADPEPPVWAAGGFDRVLLDVPCSNTGVMRRRVDVRWRLEEEDFSRHAAVQRLLLENGLRMLRAGGGCARRWLRWRAFTSRKKRAASLPAAAWTARTRRGS
jgi:16S rRNA (cytosine967-C5)-methyltransferase